ncbi:Protein NUCLEAR FUSION DEFECTIVE 2 [Euphorbia peplus]|nr:Protein NUCLEAR FUSION DEFECTIVE 2 [Euphorbia peplus]
MSCPLPRLFPAVVLCTFLLPVILASNIKPYASSSSPFESSLKVLQKSINYSFENDSLLRRAMTHPSFSEENNKAIAVVGLNVINTFVAIRSVGKDIDVSSKDLNRLIAQAQGFA